MSTVITSIDRRSPADRYGIKVGEKLLEINGHEILWGWYRFNDEYDRPNMYYISAAQITEGEALEILVVEPSIREGGITLDESYLFSIWETVNW